MSEDVGKVVVAGDKRVSIGWEWGEAEEGTWVHMRVGPPHPIPGPTKVFQRGLGGSLTYTNHTA
ncbi:hypothetical protein QQP08_016196 [Theobroma cacao]|nr:hypothetical protein QQP08_016196 [Theobroma cacao]